MKRQRYDRSNELLDIGARLVSKYGAANVTRRMVAKQAGVTDALVSSYFGSAEEARKKYTRRARAMGLSIPDKDETERLGVEMRKKPRKKPLRTLTEVQNIHGRKLRTL